MITTGRISTRSNARTHAAINGRTLCGTKSHASIAHVAKTYASIDKAGLCKLCFTPAHMTVLQHEVTSAPRWSAALDNFLCDVRIIVGYGPQITVPKVATIAPVTVAAPAKQLSAWGAMANGFRKTHAQPANV